MVEHLIVQGKVVAGNNVDAGILLDLPVDKSQTLSLRKEVGLREVPRPVFNMMLAYIGPGVGEVLDD